MSDKAQGNVHFVQPMKSFRWEVVTTVVTTVFSDLGRGWVVLGKFPPWDALSQNSGAGSRAMAVAAAAGP